jgi:hypothetical protein
MRLIHTSLTTLAVVAVTGTAFAATTRDEVNATMGGTSRIASGGQLKLVVTHKSKAKQFRIVIRYDVTVRSKTVLGFAVHPCKSTSCARQSVSKITLFPGLRHVTFTGHVPVVRRDDGRACVYAQIRDLGPKGKAPGTIVRHGRFKGVSLCRKAP